MDKRTEEFLNDPIFPLLVKMSAPNTVAFFIQSIGPLLLLYLEAWELPISQELRDCCGIQYF
jgi:hypothetical protein